MSNHTNNCPLITLTRSNECVVEYCPECQVVHLQIQFVVLKLDRQSLPDLCKILNHSERSLSELEYSGYPQPTSNDARELKKLH